MKNKNEKIKKDDRNEEPTYKAGEVMSMLEQLNDGIQLLAEQHVGVMDRFDGVDKRFNGIDNRLDGIDNRLDGIDNRLDGIDGRLDRLESKTDCLQDDITEIKYKLSEKVDRDEFEKLEKRMIKLEKLVFAKLL